MGKGQCVKDKHKFNTKGEMQGGPWKRKHPQEKKTQTVAVSVWLLAAATLSLWAPWGFFWEREVVRGQRRAWDKQDPTRNLTWTVKGWSLCFCFLPGDREKGLHAQ